MKKTFKLSVPYLGKAVVVTVVSFSCAISAYQLYQNSSIFSPQSQALDLKNNQVVFSNQKQQVKHIRMLIFQILFHLSKLVKL